MMRLPAFLCCALLFSAALALAQPKRVESLKDDSWVAYKLVHPLHEVEAKSKDVMFLFEIDEAAKTIEHVTARVDVTTFDSGNSNRDSHAMEVIEALTYPEASFTSTSVQQSGDSVHVTGNLTFHGVTRSINVNGVARWSPGRLDVDGSFTISMTEFKIERPTLLMIPVEDGLTFTLKTACAL